MDDDRGRMQVGALFADEDAVSPVIGVILMVAITVILASVIGVFTIGLGQQANEKAPDVNFDKDYDETNEKLNVTFVHGEPFEADHTSWVEEQGSVTVSTDFSGTVSSGDEATLTDVDGGETVRLVWSNSEGSSSATLMRWVGPDA